jgi:hypothetical protein
MTELQRGLPPLIMLCTGHTLSDPTSVIPSIPVGLEDVEALRMFS